METITCSWLALDAHLGSIYPVGSWIRVINMILIARIWSAH